ncbi:MAG: hypothetical protein NTX25_23160 [Proteobacteria bacterium]|nr:hypothetical protein [Pseudomonadota bacterium]
MQHPLWDDEMKFELFRFRSELKTESIRVLAEPMGLGLVKRDSNPGRSLYPQLAQKPLENDPASNKASLGKAVQVASPTKAYPSPGEMTAASLQLSSVPSIPQGSPVPKLKPQGPSMYWRHWGFLLASHCVDLAFVGLCLGLGFVVLGWVIDPANMSFHPKILAQAVPIQVLQKVNGWALVLGVYIVFSCYWLFFKFVSGVTLGETCLHNFSHGGEPSRAATGKGSGDS